MNLIAKEFLALDENRQLIGILKPINVQWNRKYYQAGDFAMQLLIENYDPRLKFVYSPNKELCLVQKVEYSDDGYNKFIMISGFFAEKQLDDLIVENSLTQWQDNRRYSSQESADGSYRGFVMNDTPENIVRYMASSCNLKGLPITLGEVSGIGTSVQYRNNGVDISEVGKAAYALLQTQEQSMRIDYDFENDTQTLVVWQGVDRTQDQNENPFVCFSQDRGNIDSCTYTIDGSNFKNVIEVQYTLGQIEDYEITDDYKYKVTKTGFYRKLLVLRLQSGDDKKLTLRISGSKTEAMDEDNGVIYYSSSKIQNEVLQYAKEQALKYINIINLDVSTNTTNYIYGEDFNLGDVCDVILPEIGISFKSRIIEIYEVYKDGGCELSLVFGDKIPTNIAKARLQ